MLSIGLIRDVGHGSFTLPSLVILVILLGYVAYYRYFHPLAKYPGPFAASLTDSWKAYQLSTLRLPQKLVQLHDQYGEVVRVGPNDLSFRSSQASGLIYKAGGRKMPKTKFYDGFTAFLPNLFGTQDEEIHSIRRRQMAHAFSMNSIREMEGYIDTHMQKLLDNLEHFCTTGETFDLKDYVAFYVLDVLGELAFSRSFDAQTIQDPEKLPPINDHIYLACLMGMMPEVMPIFKAVAPRLPLAWFQSLFQARKQLKDLTAECVARRIHNATDDRKDLLTNLINAVDPETGAKLTELEINTEAFAMLVAGAHTTSGTLTLLFAHLLQNPSIVAKLVEELDTVLGDVESEIAPINGLEAKLPYTMACINENFRINPVFTMPLPRQVAEPEGVEICGHFVPRGTSVFCSNHALHHDPSIWGQNHNTFDPSRFLEPKAEDLKRNLLPFSVGHRMCIGRNMAMTNILKVVVSVFRRYHLDMEDPKQQISPVSVGISEKDGPLICRVRRR